MRQTGQTVQDIKLRVALNNMTYTACIPYDIEFLGSNVVEKGLNDLKLVQQKLSYYCQECLKGQGKQTGN
jgi:hypothetical protein